MIEFGPSQRRTKILQNEVWVAIKSNVKRRLQKPGWVLDFLPTMELRRV